ncbi:MAG: hypothetical protein K2K38_05185 [Clostridia bacterium]|nr:hypothetical protein [Clostridia bacterium]
MITVESQDVFMENAKWKGKNLIAFDVANEFELEHEVRKASGQKELLCPDQGCKNPVVRYCHGEIKGAYFAHLINDKCDYADFDKNDNQVFRLLRLKLYKYFSELGYNVKCEQKVLKHHYSQLFFMLPNGSRIALEFGSKQTTANIIDNLNEEYECLGINVFWLVVSDTNYGSKENELFYLKRYLLNRTNFKEYLIIKKDGTAISQSRWDCNKYEYNGNRIYVRKFNDIYSEETPANLLIFENNVLSIKGFNERYNQWLQRKREAFEEEINIIKERERRATECKLQLSKPIVQRTIEQPFYKPININTVVIKRAKGYEERKAEIIARIDQQKVQVRDSSDVRWIRCEICGKIGEDAEFSSYGGPNHINLGICSDCTRKARK